MVSHQASIPASIMVANRGRADREAKGTGSPKFWINENSSGKQQNKEMLNPPCQLKEPLEGPRARQIKLPVGMEEKTVSLIRGHLFGT